MSNYTCQKKKIEYLCGKRFSPSFNSINGAKLDGLLHYAVEFKTSEFVSCTKIHTVLNEIKGTNKQVRPRVSQFR